MDTKTDPLQSVLQMSHANTFNTNRAFQVKDKDRLLYFYYFLKFLTSSVVHQIKVYIQKVGVYGQYCSNFILLF